MKGVFRQWDSAQFNTYGSREFLNKLTTVACQHTVRNLALMTQSSKKVFDTSIVVIFLVEIALASFEFWSVLTTIHLLLFFIFIKRWETSTATNVNKLCGGYH